VVSGKRGNAGRDILSNARRARHTIQSSRYAFSPDALVKPKPTTQTAIATARNFRPKASASSAVTLISDHFAVVSLVMPSSVKNPRIAMQAAFQS